MAAGAETQTPPIHPCKVTFRGMENGERLGYSRLVCLYIPEEGVVVPAGVGGEGPVLPLAVALEPIAACIRASTAPMMRDIELAMAV